MAGHRGETSSAARNDRSDHEPEFIDNATDQQRLGYRDAAVHADVASRPLLQAPRKLDQITVDDVLVDRLDNGAIEPEVLLAVREVEQSGVGCRPPHVVVGDDPGLARDVHGRTRPLHRIPAGAVLPEHQPAHRNAATPVGTRRGNKLIGRSPRCGGAALRLGAVVQSRGVGGYPRVVRRGWRTPLVRWLGPQW
jgi:hypothetical protein